MAMAKRLPAALCSCRQGREGLGNDRLGATMKQHVRSLAAAVVVEIGEITIGGKQGYGQFLAA